MTAQILSAPANKQEQKENRPYAGRYDTNGNFRREPENPRGSVTNDQERASEKKRGKSKPSVVASHKSAAYMGTQKPHETYGTAYRDIQADSGGHGEKENFSELDYGYAAAGRNLLSADKKIQFRRGLLSYPLTGDSR